MQAKFANQAVLGILLICQFPICLADEAPDANASSKYLDAVREFADNVLKYGRDTYGPKHTPLFVDGLNIHTHEPVKWISPKGNLSTTTETEKWILSNFASQQTLLRTLDGLSTVTGDPKYRDAAKQAIKYAFENLTSRNGLIYWGQLTAYDAQRDRVRGAYGPRHTIKQHYPYYELMWEVDPESTEQFIESFWSAHILDWSNLDMNRGVSLNKLPVAKGWDHEYDEEGPAFFKSKSGAFGFLPTGTSLIQAGTTLYRLSRQEQPFVWSKRLAKRYIDTRHPKTGISGYIYNNSVPPLGDDLKEHFADPRTTFFPSAPLRKTRPISGPEYTQAHSWISLLLVGDMLGEQGRDFSQWTLEELTAWGKVSYRKEDNSFTPILTDGTSIEGYVCKESNYYAPKGAIVKPLFADLTFFWAYAMAYRTTSDEFMWLMARDIGMGNSFGNIGRSPGGTPELQTDTSCSNVYGLLGFLELYNKTNKPEFLRMAQRIGDNIIDNQFYKGFFVPTRKHIYTRFDCFEPLALLHLQAAVKSRSGIVPQVWPSNPLFVPPYRYKQEAIDRFIIYTLTESSEPPMSLQEAAAIGDINMVSSLLEKGTEVDSWDDSLRKTALQHAAMRGHREVVALLISKGARIDAQDDYPGGTSLDYAAEGGHKEIVELLITNGADVNAKRLYHPEGDTPLHSAARTGQKDIVELLLAHGADVNHDNNNGFAPLHYAVQRNNLDLVKLLLANGAEISSIHVAAKVGDVNKVTAYLDQGIDINAKDEQGKTVLFYAVRGNHKDIVKLLVAKGADINARDKGGYTPLCYAIWNDDKDLAGFLISKGADVTLTAEKDYPPIYYAVWNDDLDTVKLLVAKGAKFDVKVLDDRTAFHYALSQGSKDIVEFFVSKGADVSTFHGAACLGDLDRVKGFVEKGTDVDIKDELGWTPLYWAASTGQEEVAEFLIAKGADVGAKVEDSSTPLHQAARAGAIKLVKLLIDKGADVNGKNKRGNTPLHSAASAGHREIAELLIANGADVNAKTTNGWTALHRAALGGHRNVVEILISHGANVTVKDSRGRTAADWAGQRGHKEIVELLRKNESK